MLRRPGAQRLVDGRRPEPVRDEMRRAKAIHVLAEQRMVVDRVAQLHRVLDLPLHQLGAFQRHLPAAQVQRREDLVVGRGRGVRHVGLVERHRHLLVEVLIVDVDHRSLPQRGQRLVRRLRGIHPHPGPRRVGHQPTVQQVFVAGLCRRSGRPDTSRTAPCIQGSAAARAAPAAEAIAVRVRYTGWNRAKANHASSHRNTRSGLIARHSSITRSTS